MGGHRRGHRRDDAGEGSLPSEDEEECGVRIHPGHNSPSGLGWESVPDSEPGGCSHAAQGTAGHTHPWAGNSDEGTEIGTGHEWHVHPGRFESRKGMRFLVPLRSYVPVKLLTSAMQVTREPLNSRPSSFSMAVFRSLAVSNSTNLGGICQWGPVRPDRKLKN